MLDPVLEELKTYHADSFGWALNCCAWHRDEAEDVLQEAYLRVLDGRAVFAGKSTAKTWFFAVIKRVAADAHRARKRHSILGLRVLVSDRAAVEGSVTTSANPLPEAVQAEQSSQALQDALMQLSVRQRDVLHLVFYAELTLEETAKTLHMSLGSVRTHYHRGKQRVAQLLKLDESHAQ